MIKYIKIGFVFLERRKELMLVVSTRLASANINGSIIHWLFNIHKQKNDRKNLLQGYRKHGQS